MPTGTSEVDPKFYAILNEQFLAKGKDKIFFHFNFLILVYFSKRLTKNVGIDFNLEGLKLAHRKVMGNFVIQVTDVDVADKIFKTHFHAFPHRMMIERSFGGGAEVRIEK